MSTLRDGVLLCLGTLTRVRVPAPSVVNRRVAAIAMSMAPLVGALLGIPIGLATQMLSDALGTTARGTTLLAATLAVVALTWLTRALHLDGLADTADALGSGAPPERALAIARQSDIGPFGVIAIVLVIAVQIACITALAELGLAGIGIALAVVTGRLAATAACTRGVPAARHDGLGATVAGSVPRWVAPVWFMALAAVMVLAPAPGPDTAAAGPSLMPAEWRVSALIGLLAGAVTVLIALRTARRRLGGITGDVLGWSMELVTTSTLVTMTLVASALA